MHTKQFCHVFAVAIDVVDFCCDFFFPSDFSFFFICSLFSPFFFVVCSFFRSFHILYSDINESLIEQKITSVQSDAYFKEPVDKKLVYMFDAKLKWIEWAANSYPFLEPVRVRRVYRNMRRKKKKKQKKTSSPKHSNTSTEFLSDFWSFICGRIWTEIKQFPM